MKTKQEQIEEIAKIIDEMYWVYDTTAGDIAEGIYDAGYRKVPFDIRRCFNEIEMKMKFKTDFGTIDFTEEQILFIEQAICWEEEKIRKETAKEILDKLNALMEQYHYKSTAWRNCTNFIKETYGVEVEE